MFQQATRPRTPLRRLSCSPRNRAVSDELAPWTSLSCGWELGRNFPPLSQGGDSCQELVAEPRPSSASVVSRVSVNTASAAIIIDSADTSAFVADSSSSSIGVAEARFAARRSSSTLARFLAFSASASARRIASRFERFTPDPEEGSYAIGTVSSELLCRFDSWSSRASSAPVSRSRFVIATGHIVSGTVVGRTRSLLPHSANLCDIAHPDTSCTQVFTNSTSVMGARALPTLAGLTQGHPTDSHATHHDDAALRLDAKQSPHLSQQSNRETKFAETAVVCRHHHVDRTGYDRSRISSVALTR